MQRPHRRVGAEHDDLTPRRHRCDGGVRGSADGSDLFRRVSAESVGARVSMWGPFAIEEELYDRALAQKARLESRAIQYKAVDEKFRPEEASNCIHAVSDIDRDQGLLHVGRNWGEPASQLVVNHLKRWIINPRQTHQWVRDQIGLQDYPLTVRALE